jgi:hypothetical protein
MGVVPDVVHVGAPSCTEKLSIEQLLDSVDFIASRFQAR